LLSDEEAQSAPPASMPSADVQPLESLLAPEMLQDFDLDLGAAANLEVVGRDAMQSLASPEREADAPTPDEVSALMSLDVQPSTPELPAVDPSSAAAGDSVDPSTARGPVQLDSESTGDAAIESPPEEAELAYRMIGPLRVGIPLFNIFLNEADEQSRRLGVELAEWSHEYMQKPVGDHAVALAHSLAGNSATVGFSDLSHMARLLEHALVRSNAIGEGDAQEGPADR
jgi:chemosensory pili system protein ChpA (sensor histidine kinase/response regulator)